MPHSTGLRGRELIKGHATLNDFLMLVDPGCEVAISGADIAAVCHRHRGLGAEGRSARTLRACSHSSLDKAATSEILARRPLLPTTRPAALRRWQRP